MLAIIGHSHSRPLNGMLVLAGIGCVLLLSASPRSAASAVTGSNAALPDAALQMLPPDADQQLRQILLMRLWDLDSHLIRARLQRRIRRAQPSDDLGLNLCGKAERAAVEIEALEVLLAHLLEHDGVIDDPGHSGGF